MGFNSGLKELNDNYLGIHYSLIYFIRWIFPVTHITVIRSMQENKTALEIRM